MYRLTSLIFIAASVGMFSAVGQETVAVNSSISQVTAYLDRARVTRTANVGLPAGTSIVEFGGLPENLDEASVAVSAKSDRGLTIEGIDIRQRFLTESANPRAQELERQIHELQDQKRSLEEQKSIIGEKREFFKNLSLGLGKGEKEAINLDDIRKLYAFYGEEVSNLAENILSIGRSEAKLNVEIDRLQRELDALRGAAQKAQRALLVSIKAEAAAKAELAIRYAIGDASWGSSYDAKVDSSTGKVALLYNAFVRQKTGEDWSNVRLGLSTAQPGKNGQMAELAPAFLDMQADHPGVYAMARTQPAPATAPGQAAKAKDESAEVTEAQAEIRRMGLSVNYDVGLPVSVPSDGQPHRTNIIVLDLAGVPQYVTTPKLDPAVFLKVHLTNTSEAQLLPGPLNLFRDGEFIGSVPMGLVPPTSEFDLYVGRDDSIKVERKETISKRSETGLLNRKEVEERRYQIALQNFRPGPIRVLVYDQIPVSKNSDITVNQGDFSDKPTAVDKDTGKLTWEIELPPKLKKVIEFGYSVEWPKGKEISGTL
ncbi:MAG TPA: mucoidy inhibitor MuiA family protein [Chthoniobacterales bacterium]